MAFVGDYYVREGLMEEYPIRVMEDEHVCALCKGATPNSATGVAYAKIANQAMDVKRDLAGTGGRINGGVIEVKAPACEHCLENLAKCEKTSKRTLVIFSVLTVLVSFAVSTLMNLQGGLTGLAILGASAALGFGGYMITNRSLQNRINSETVTDVMDLPALKGFKEKKWYVRGTSRFKPTLHAEPPMFIYDERDPVAVQQAEQARRKRREEEKKTPNKA
ncbi:MAG: hypothetical protein IJN00_04525, partial [Clostridia bacterium]|nr:hypothetical protein [Clostridia bacterium]